MISVPSIAWHQMLQMYKSWHKAHERQQKSFLWLPFALQQKLILLGHQAHNHLFFKIPRSFSSCSVTNLGRFKSFLCKYIQCRFKRFFRLNFKTWPVYDHVASWERRKIILEIAGKGYVECFQNQPSFSECRGKDSYLWPFNPTPQFLCTGMLGAFGFAIHKLALAAWKMHSCQFSHLAFIFLSRVRSSTWALILPLLWAVQLWGEQMLALGHSSEGSRVQNINNFFPAFLPSQIPPKGSLFSSPSWLSRVFPPCEMSMAAGWLSGVSQVRATGAVCTQVWHYALGNISLRLKFQL